MLKMTVRPLAIRNSSIPNRTPFSVEMTTSSSTTCTPRQMICLHPGKSRGEAISRWRPLVRAVHLAGGGQYGLVGLDLGGELPAPARLFLVERLLLGALAERGDVHRLEELVVVLAHVALAAVEDFELHAFKGRRHLDRIERLGLFGRGREHPHLVDG